jgi:histidyl-tRNA synthetase
VGGGGRYDGLVEQLGGPPTPGIGWAAGIERIMLAGESRAVAPTPVALFIALEHASADLRARAFGLLSEARSAGLAAQMDLGGRSLKGQLGHANALGARFVAIVGEAQSMLKDMQGGGQEALGTDAVVHAVLRAHHAL